MRLRYKSTLGTNRALAHNSRFSCAGQRIGACHSYIFQRLRNGRRISFKRKREKYVSCFICFGSVVFLERWLLGCLGFGQLRSVQALHRQLCRYKLCRCTMHTSRRLAIVVFARILHTGSYHVAHCASILRPMPQTSAIIYCFKCVSGDFMTGRCSRAR